MEQQQQQDSFEMAVHGPCCGPIKSQRLPEHEPVELESAEKPQYWIPCD